MYQLIKDLGLWKDEHYQKGFRLNDLESVKVWLDYIQETLGDRPVERLRIAIQWIDDCRLPFTLYPYPFTEYPNNERELWLKNNESLLADWGYCANPFFTLRSRIVRTPEGNVSPVRINDLGYAIASKIWCQQTDLYERHCIEFNRLTRREEGCFLSVFHPAESYRSRGYERYFNSQTFKFYFDHVLKIQLRFPFCKWRATPQGLFACESQSTQSDYINTNSEEVLAYLKPVRNFSPLRSSQ